MTQWSQTLRRALRAVLILGGAIGGAAALLWGVQWWLWSQTHVLTENAYVHADVAQITPRVAGTVLALAVDENWEVKAGDLLVRLDPADYKLSLQQSEAALATAIQAVEAARAAARAADSQIAVADAQLSQARLDHQRAADLAARGAVSRDQLDRALTVLHTAEAQAAHARREAERAYAALGIAVDAPADEAAGVRQVRAARDQAALMLSYTALYAPSAGVIAKRSVEIGQRVQPGQPLMAVVPVHDAYVEANFKETELTNVRVGQPATVVADIYPGFAYQGRVDGLSPGTGAAFALLPPQNASGNWVKVVQRLPVRIRLGEPAPPDHPLRIGLSVVVTIDTSRVDGPFLRPLTQTAVAER
jgi:membrane fusion protein (multidrug efflux system)